MDIKLVYFDSPFWRAEVARLALFVGGIEFKDIRIDGEEFKTIKSTGAMTDGTKIPFKQLPALSVNGTCICQTGAIARFCGKISNLYSEDLLECAQIDQIIDLLTDMNVLIRPAMIEKDTLKKSNLRAELSEILLPNKIQLLENLISEKDDKEFCVGNKVSIADLGVWRVMGWLSTGVIDGISMDILAPFPHVLGVCQNIADNPKVIEWVSLTYPSTYRWLQAD
jgi:glutathione S-transferase